MTRQFDAEYWEQHYQGSPGPYPSQTAMSSGPGDPNPHLVREISPLSPGRALDAGCGHGIEAAWLAEQGWKVTGVDISRTALDRAARILRARGMDTRVELIAADLTTWVPEGQYELVTTHYAHPTIPQLDFYRRVSGWVAPAGTLLIIGHLHGEGDAHEHDADAHGAPGRDADAHGTAEHDAPGHRGNPPLEAQVRAADVAALLDESSWRIETAAEMSRTTLRGQDSVTLHDVVVRAIRLS
ncbi:MULTISPECIES: class I SAM-dependent methyltransferase [Actinomycetes]|uniref:Class I SAM-dependent methyltransferase n=2 Tax=Actinomycetes TaxID=1760 RepID=A0ABP6M2M5_9MICC